jgi:hypothetical protein
MQDVTNRPNKSPEPTAVGACRSAVAVYVASRQGPPFEVAIPNKLTTRTLRDAKAGKNVRRFRAKKELYGDLGL